MYHDYSIFGTFSTQFYEQSVKRRKTKGPLRVRVREQATDDNSTPIDN